MRRIIILALSLSVLWMGWWVFGSANLERSLTAWLDERRQAGWVADYADLNVRGFPSRFDTRITDVRLADPTTGIAWSAPFFDILQLSYRPNSAILVWPDRHVFATPLQSTEILTSRARGSLTLRPTPSLELDRATIVLEDLRLVSTPGGTVSASEARVSARREDRDNAYRFGAEVTGLVPSDSFVETLNPAGVLPETIRQLRLDVTLDLTGPLDRSVIEAARPQITAIDLGELSATWGQVLFRAAGELSVDRRGIPTGDISLRAEEWRRLLDMAVTAGAIPESAVPLLEGTLSLMARINGSEEDLDATLSFQRDRIFLGPIPLGPAPRIVLR